MIFDHLEGSWEFQRIVPSGKMNGIARFTKKSAHEYHYREEGYFIGGFYQEYIYRLEDGQIVIYFNENPPRLFHRLEFINHSHAYGSHLCQCDLYEAFFHFESLEKFTIQYIVKGPQKDHSILTYFKFSKQLMSNH